MTKSELVSMGRDQLLKLAERYLELKERTALSLIEQNKPAEDQTIPTCLFCDLIVAEGKLAVAATSGAIICEDCVASANAHLIGRPDVRIAIRAVDESDDEVCTEPCATYPACHCGGEDPKLAARAAAKRNAPCPSFPGCGCTNLDSCRRYGS